ncbi:MAG: sigma 54-interacting transcriptional regulator [Polyangiaceae bacterium]
MGCPPDTTATLQKERLELSKLSRFVVRVVEGPDRGKSWTLDADRPCRVLVGSGPACEVRLTDRHVSRRHAALDLDGTELRLTDLGSTNGTLLGTVRVIEAIISPGAVLRLGDTTLGVEASAPESAYHLTTRSAFGAMVGESMAMRRLYPLCERLAASDVPVLVEGETGTGKELVAEALHSEGKRAAGPFVVFDCAAITPSLVESHLFGHERGAFTGATHPRRGVFELASGGTLFIDEIGDLDISLQARLLRAIERGEVCRVGSERWISVDVRIVAATRRDLDKEVQAGRFRDDLFFRLAVARLELPPLRRRHGDVGLLARHFWDRQATPEQVLPYELFERFEEYDWPGNVRELHNAVARRAALGDLAEFEVDAGETDVGDVIERILESELPLSTAKQKLMLEFERRYVERMLARHGGDVTKAVAASGIARRYFNVLRAKHRQ